MENRPEPSLIVIANLHHIQAMLSLGAMPNPMTGHPNPVNRDAARYELSLLEILREKTTGNLEENEEKLLDEMIDSIRRSIEAV